MLCALAPMEGITGYIFRRAHATCFGPADKYMTPFVSPTQHLCFTARERKEIGPEHNAGLNVVPQILTRDPAHFIWAARALADMGYREINLNLGCPSGTVAAKGKGSGFLAYPDELYRVFDAVFSALTVDISVKTRVGKNSPDEWPRLLEIFDRYPICELTVHPRVQADRYNGTPDLAAFALAAERSRAPLCYNGDLYAPGGLAALSAAFPGVERFMCGRGVVADPSLLRQLRGGPPARKGELAEFHGLLYDGYRAVMPGPRPVLARMKELWSYLLFSFTNREKYVRLLRKAGSLSEYEDVIHALFRDEDLVPAGAFDPAKLI